MLVRVRVRDNLTSTVQGVTSLCIISFKWSGFEMTLFVSLKTHHF